MQNGTVRVTSINSVVGGLASSSLGTPTTVAAGTISLGSGGQSAQLSYLGAGQSTDRVIDLAGTTGGGTIDSSGSGGLTFTSDLTASGAGSKTLTLTGSFTGLNKIQGAIVDYDAGNTTSVVKTGATSWVLGGANSYTGPTTISAGKLYLNGSNTTSSVSVAGGSTLGGSGSTGGGCRCGRHGDDRSRIRRRGLVDDERPDVRQYGHSERSRIVGAVPQRPRDRRHGALTASGGVGSVVINLPVGGLASGTYRLLSYTGTIGGSNGFNAFTLGTQPAIGGRQTAQFVDNANEIDLVITGLSSVWTGAYSSEWSTNSLPNPKNWELSGTNTSTDFFAGDAVVFDTTAANQIVDISQANVTPATVSINGGNYLLKSTPGTFGIAGSGSLDIEGGSLRITNVNTFTGGTTLSGGQISFVSGGLGTTGTIKFTGNGTLQWATGNTDDISSRLVIHDGAVATLDVQDNNVTLANSFGGGGNGGAGQVGQRNAHPFRGQHLQRRHDNQQWNRRLRRRRARQLRLRRLRRQFDAAMEQWKHARPFRPIVGQRRRRRHARHPRQQSQLRRGYRRQYRQRHQNRLRHAHPGWNQHVRRRFDDQRRRRLDLFRRQSGHRRSDHLEKWRCPANQRLP